MIDGEDPSPCARKMPRRGVHSFYTALVWSSLCASANAACGSSSEGSGLPMDGGDDSDEGIAQCPATADLTIGARCADEGLLCGPQYTCDLVQVPLLCVCSKGFFACTDGSGNAVGAGETPRCTAAAGARCPADERSATAASCSEIGLVCPYPSACDGGVDSCECSPGPTADGAPSLVFACLPATCSASEADAVDAAGGADGAPGTAASAPSGDDP